MSDPTPEFVADRTRVWIQRVVIDLGLCPFVGAIFHTDRIRYSVSAATTPNALLEDLAAELVALMAVPPAVTETVLLIHPHTLGGFAEYNDFLDRAEAVLAGLELHRKVQIASFHPHYQFAGTRPAAIANYTNRSPYPMLHLLRQSSVAAARATYPDIEGIPGRNIATLEGLGPEAEARLRDGIG